ncbi:MAG: hypothetical protein JWO02_3590 [Solirubrobacterales bacterium]|nr:hypothetical protein [Solirubrobacterales bacterium]
MSFPIGTPPGVNTGAYDATGRMSGPERPAAGTFARVYELEEARRRRDVPIPPIAGDRIPDEVWDEVDAAARLFEKLQAEGRRVVFDTDRLTGRVVASLLDADGAVSDVPLTDAVSPPGRPAGPAALAPGGLPAAYGGSGGVG